MCSLAKAHPNAYLVVVGIASCALSMRAQVPDQPGPVLCVARVERREIVLELGPFDLPAAPAAQPGHDHMDMGEPPVRVIALNADGWLHGFRFDIVDEHGRLLPSQLLHHVNVIVPQKRELFSNIMLRIAAAGAETAPVMLPGALGYRVHPGDSVLVSAMLHNPSTRPYSGVRLRMRISYTASGPLMSPLSIYPFYLDVMPPAGSHSFDVPPGHSERFWEGRPAIAGRILGVGGHVHRYGTALRLEDVTDHKVLWDAKPDTDATGEVVGFPVKRFFWSLGIAVEPSHLYRLTAVYDNPTGHAIEDGGMGALGGAFLPIRPSAWPQVARDNPEYLADRRITYRLHNDSSAQP